ncbi:MAG: efflux RND transporter permease subunit [Endomicrobium sp.]|jgi:HAE1 family hydrophobic/amphiphilic exporter-1|nr:efflux RND transporter permease subunit [Endomicrobium sp.]
MNLAKLSIKRPTFIMAILMTVLILGVVSLSKLSVRMFPDVDFPYVAAIITYPGAGVNEIEQLVTKPVEDAVSSVAGLKHLTSINQDSLSIVFAEFVLSKDPDIATQEIRDKIGQIRQTLPEDIEEPIILKADMDSMPLVTISLKSDTMSPKELYDFAYDVVSKDFSQVSGVSQIQIVGGSRREIHVNADKIKLKEHELTLTALASRIKANTLNVPAGKVDRGEKEITYRTMGEFSSVKKINDVVVSFVGNDVPVTVKDVATVEDGVKDEISRARLDFKDENGNIIYEPSLLMHIYRQAKGNDVAISDGVKNKIDEVNVKYQKFNGNPKITLISDTAQGVRRNLADVKDTIVEGIFLAVVVVYFFLGSWRSTFITALALPNSLIGAFVFMYAFGFSLNVISLMSLSLAVGLLIDDAIVVRENIFRHYEEGANSIKAAIDGTNEVTLAVIATTSTVIAVFFPVAFLSGIMGQFFREFGLTVVFAMLISVLDALTIAPMLSAYIIPQHKETKAKAKMRSGILGIVEKFRNGLIYIFRLLTVVWFNKLFGFVEFCYAGLISFIVKKDLLHKTFNLNKKIKNVFVYIIKYKFLFFILSVFLLIFGISKKIAHVPSVVFFIIALTAFLVFAFINFFNFEKNKLCFSISWKFMTLMIIMIIFVFTIVGGKSLQNTFMPNSEWGEFNVTLVSKPGTSLEQMDKYARDIEEIIMSAPDVELISSSVGSADMFSSMANKTSIYVKMIDNPSKGGIIKRILSLFSKKKQKEPSKKRMRSTSQMKDYLREVLNKKYGEELDIAITRQLLGGSQSEFIMELTGDDIDILYEAAQTLIERFKSIPHLVDLTTNYKPGKPEIRLQMDASKMEVLGVNSVIIGTEVRAMIDGAIAGKYRENGLEYDIRVRLQENQKDISKAFSTIYVNNINNKLIKLKNVAALQEAEGPTQIFRKDRTRFVSVEGNLSEGGAIGTVQKAAFKIFYEEKYANPKNAQKWKNIEIRESGNAEEMATMQSSIAIAALLSLMFIFMVLASLYESVITPFTIMTALPLGIIGGIIALLIAGQPIDMFTLIGMIMLLGIVAKNSILLVDYIQQQMRAGVDIDNAIIKAGSIRLRPILMTSFALIAGMMPTALGLSEVGQFRKGMGIVVIGGIIASTVLTLIIVPAIFEYMEIFRRFLRKTFSRPRKRMIDYTEEKLKDKGLA